MARGRFLSKQISKNEELGDLSEEAGLLPVLLFTWMLAHLDCEGRCSGNPRIIRGHVFPLLEVRSEEIADALRSLVAKGLIRWYQTPDGKRVVEYPNFEEHQQGLRKDREAPSAYTPYDSATCELVGVAPVRSRSGVGPDQVPAKGEGEVEGEVEEKPRPSGNLPASSTPPAPTPSADEGRGVNPSGRTAAPGERSVAITDAKLRAVAIQTLGLGRPRRVPELQAISREVQYLLHDGFSREALLEAMHGFALLREEGALADCGVPPGKPVTPNKLRYFSKDQDTGEWSNLFWYGEGDRRNQRHIVEWCRERYRRAQEAEAPRALGLQVMGVEL